MTCFLIPEEDDDEMATARKYPMPAKSSGNRGNAPRPGGSSSIGPVRGGAPVRKSGNSGKSGGKRR